MDNLFEDELPPETKILKDHIEELNAQQRGNKCDI